MQGTSNVTPTFLPPLNLSNPTLLGGGVQRSTEEVSRRGRGGVQRKDGGNFLIVIPRQRLGAQVILFSILSRFSLTIVFDNFLRQFTQKVTLWAGGPLPTVNRSYNVHCFRIQRKNSVERWRTLRKSSEDDKRETSEERSRNVV